jgi:hypothetical protein
MPWIDRVSAKIRSDARRCATAGSQTASPATAMVSTLSSAGTI